MSIFEDFNFKNRKNAHLVKMKQSKYPNLPMNEKKCVFSLLYPDVHPFVFRNENANRCTLKIYFDFSINSPQFTGCTFL